MTNLLDLKTDFAYWNPDLVEGATDPAGRAPRPRDLDTDPDTAAGPVHTEERN